jgi:hypothetical protein
MSLKEIHIIASAIVFFVVFNITEDLLDFPKPDFIHILHLTHENAIPTWLSNVILLLGALAAYQGFKIGRQKNIAGARAFLVAAILLAAMSCDEVAQIHERIGDWIPVLHLFPADWKRNARWVWVGGPIILVLFAFAINALRKPLSLAPGSNLLLAGGFGAIFLGGVVIESTINWLNHEELQWIWDAETIVEEGLELVGGLLILYGLTAWNRAMAEPTPR